MTQRAHRRQFLRMTLGAGVAVTGRRLVTAQGTPSASPVAAPVAGAVGSGPTRLGALLQSAPAHLLSPAGVVWADLAAALRLAKLAPFSSATPKPDQAHQQALRNLDLPVGLFDYALEPDYAPTFGFSPFQMEQALTIGQSSDTRLTFVRGPWNASALIRAWTASKYKAVRTAAGTVWSWADGPELDLSDPVSEYGLGAMNNAAILPDGTLVFGMSVDGVKRALETAQGTAVSVADDARIAGLVASAPPELVSAVVLPGLALHQQAARLVPVHVPTPALAAATEAAQEQQAEQQAVGVMPTPSFGLVGITGGLTDPHIIVRLAVKNRAEADRAATIMAYRLKHARSMSRNTPLADLLTLVRAEGQATPPVAKADFAPKNVAASIWYDMIQAKDLVLLGWG